MVLATWSRQQQGTVPRADLRLQRTELGRKCVPENRPRGTFLTKLRTGLFPEVVTRSTHTHHPPYTPEASHPYAPGPFTRAGTSPGTFPQGTCALTDTRTFAASTLTPMTTTMHILLTILAFIGGFYLGYQLGDYRRK